MLLNHQIFQKSRICFSVISSSSRMAEPIIRVLP